MKFACDLITMIVAAIVASLLLTLAYVNSFRHNTLFPLKSQHHLWTRSKLRQSIINNNLPPENRKYPIVKPYNKLGPNRPSISKGILNLLTGKGWSGNAIITKESLSKFGLNCLLAYGFVSNFSYITCVIIAWITHGKKYNISPLAPGQWKQFLLIYSGLWVANNVLRPARFTLSLALSPFFERAVRKIEETFNWNRVKATSLLVFLVNFCGTISYLVFGLLFATRIANVPLWP